MLKAMVTSILDQQQEALTSQKENGHVRYKAISVVFSERSAWKKIHFRHWTSKGLCSRGANLRIHARWPNKEAREQKINDRENLDRQTVDSFLQHQMSATRQEQAFQGRDTLRGKEQHETKSKFTEKTEREKDNTFFLSQTCGVKRSVAHETTTLKLNTNWPHGSHKEPLHKLKTTTVHQIRTAIFSCKWSPTSSRPTTFSCKCFPQTSFIWATVVFVLQILERNEVWNSLSLASSRCATLACSHCMRSWPMVALPNKLSHTASSLSTQRQHSWSCTVPTHTACLPPRQARSWTPRKSVFVWILSFTHKILYAARSNTKQNQSSLVQLRLEGRWFSTSEPVS